MPLPELWNNDQKNEYMTVFKDRNNSGRTITFHQWNLHKNYTNTPVLPKMHTLHGKTWLFGWLLIGDWFLECWHVFKSATGRHLRFEWSVPVCINLPVMCGGADAQKQVFRVNTIAVPNFQTISTITLSMDICSKTDYVKPLSCIRFNLWNVIRFG